MRKSLFIAVMSIMSLGIYAQKNLTVKVTDIAVSKGSLYVALFKTKNTFLEKPTETKTVKVEGNVAEIVFKGLKKGKYAVALFQDENSNGKLDLGPYSIPMEAYGFSNNVNLIQLKRQPTFSECMFKVTGDTEISVKLMPAIIIK